MAVDKVYTPDTVGADVIAAVSKRSPETVADFAAGDGALLALAARRWPNASIVANDFDKSECARLRRQFPNWQVSSCDFLSAISVKRSHKLAALIGNFDLVLLNPPFSYRGWQSWRVDFRGADLSCTRAVAFVLRSLDMISSSGQVVAVLPRGCLSTKTDEAAWRAVEESFAVRVMNEYGKRTFSGYSPRTVLVQIRPRRRGPRPGVVQIPALPRVGDHFNMPVTIVRGWTQMYTVEYRQDGELLALVHSTDLSGGTLCSYSGCVSGQHSVRGPGVLMPRVGQPASSNLGILPSEHQVALSDCVIALLTATERDALALHRTLVDSWPIIEQAFGGTCARYITLDRLGSALRRCGLTNLVFRTPTDLWQSELTARAIVA
jgi:predicted RNA methylase